MSSRCELPHSFGDKKSRVPREVVVWRENGQPSISWKVDIATPERQTLEHCFCCLSGDGSHAALAWAFRDQVKGDDKGITYHGPNVLIRDLDSGEQKTLTLPGDARPCRVAAQ